VRPWYRGAASVLVRNANDPAGSLLSRFGLAGDVAGAAAGGALGGVLKSSLETEVQLLQSRELAGMVVDSLALQARVLEPRGAAGAGAVRPGAGGRRVPAARRSTSPGSPTARTARRAATRPRASCRVARARWPASAR
jgi:uncharacterized protein involved in exopolysaccharide biosynthesis